MTRLEKVLDLLKAMLIHDNMKEEAPNHHGYRSIDLSMVQRAFRIVEFMEQEELKLLQEEDERRAKLDKEILDKFTKGDL